MRIKELALILGSIVTLAACQPKEPHGHGAADVRGSDTAPADAAVATSFVHPRLSTS